MTTEKMTVHKALCELKTLDSRTQKCMQQNPFVFANKHANSKVAGVSIGDYCKEVQASYQSANDLIARRDAIKRAVTLSNATVKVTIGGKEYTVAEAIELKNHGVPLKQMLLKKLDSDNRRARMEADKNNGDVLELRADEYVGSAAGEVVDDASVGTGRPRGVEVHAGYACFGEQFAHAVLDLLRAVAATEQFGALAVWALLRHGVGVAAVVAGEKVHRAVIGERHVAVLALGYPSAHLALNHRREAAAVLEQQHLLLVAQSRAHRFE